MSGDADRHPPFVRWVHEAFGDQLGLADMEGGKAYKRFLHPPDLKHHGVSGAFRAQAFHIIKFGYPLRRSGYQAAALTARVGKLEAIYAYAYWSGEADEPEYVCYSPTYDSRDGEYRSQFLWFPQYAEAYAAVADMADPFEDRLVAAIGAGELELEVKPFGSPEGEEKISEYCGNSRLAVQLLVAALLMGPFRKLGAFRQNHVLKAYVSAISKVYEVAGGKDPGRITEKQLRGLTALESGQGEIDFTKCGQKLTPLTLREATNLNDINYAAWREVYINGLATDLVVNGVSPTFPIFGNWTYLTSVDAELFEGEAMRDRYARGLQVVGSLEKLRESRSAVATRTSAEYQIGQLDARIYNTITYALDFLVMSQFALCATSEFVGYTLRSVPTIIRGQKLVNPGYRRLFSHPEMTVRYMFDLAYGANALHTRLGVIHADLHMNNITINPFASRWELFMKEARERPTKNPVVAYVAGPRGEADTYVFPHDGFFATIIDFSRSILGPRSRARIAADRGEAYAAQYFRNQVGRTLRILHHYAPSFTAKNQEKIKGLILSMPGVMFRVLSAVDFLAVGRSFRALFKIVADTAGDPAYRNVVVLGAGSRVAEALERAALDLLVGRLSDLVAGRGSRDPKAYPFAGQVLMPRVFGDFRFAAWAADAPQKGAARRPHALGDATLTDVYNAEAPLKYSSSDPERFPPWAHLETIEKHLDGRVKMADVTADRGERPFLRAQGPDSFLDVIVERARHRAEAADHPADATSSWIAE